MVHDTQSTQHAQSKKHNTYIVTPWRQSNAPILLITTMALWQHAGYWQPVASSNSDSDGQLQLVIPPLAVHSRYVATKALWWSRGWAHWIAFMTSLYMCICIYVYIYIYIYMDIYMCIYTYIYIYIPLHTHDYLTKFNSKR